MVKLFRSGIVIVQFLLVTYFFSLGSIALASSATPSVSCYFEAEVSAHEVLHVGDMYRLYFIPSKIEGSEKCDIFRSDLVEGIWYPPTSLMGFTRPYVPRQPPVNTHDVLAEGAEILGFINSSDLIIENVQIIERFEENIFTRISERLYNLTVRIRYAFFHPKRAVSR